MVPSSKLCFVANSNNPNSLGLAPDSTLRFGSMEFTTDRIGNLSLSPQEWDSGAIFIGMVHSGSRCLHTALEESSNEGGAASSTGGSTGSPDPRGCNVVTSTDPIIATPALENTPTLQTILTVMVRTMVP
jgi:hypothetical protein